MTTFHTYSNLVSAGSRYRLAATDWARCNAAQAIAATLAADPEAIVLRVADWRGACVAIGHAPGGLG